jgi:hypothetical protein
VISRISHYIRLRVDPLYERPVLLIDSQGFLDSLQVADAREVHIEGHGDVVLRELPELEELGRGYQKGLTEEDEVHWELEFYSLVTGRTVLEVDVGLDVDLGTHVDLDFELV